MRDLVYYVATSIDGFIAREDGSFDDFPWDDAFLQELVAMYPETLPAPFHAVERSASENRRFDTVLMGRRTYEVGVRQGLTNPYPTLRQFVFSRTWDRSPDPSVTLVPSDPATFVGELKAQEGAAIWICGGSELASTLFSAGLVDEVSIKLNPVLLGTGIPLLRGPMQTRPLALREHRIYPSGHALLTYRVSE